MAHFTDEETEAQTEEATGYRCSARQLQRFSSELPWLLSPQVFPPPSMGGGRHPHLLDKGPCKTQGLSAMEALRCLPTLKPGFESCFPITYRTVLSRVATSVLALWAACSPHPQHPFLQYWGKKGMA